MHISESLLISPTLKIHFVVRRKTNAVVHTYKHGFSGFAARLSEEEAHSIAKNAGVVSVFPDPLLNLHTTHSWEFLQHQTALKVDSNPNSDSNSSSQGSDTIIGILDTGESNSQDQTKLLFIYNLDFAYALSTIFFQH